MVAPVGDARARPPLDAATVPAISDTEITREWEQAGSLSTVA